jgi:hypothetical protein
VSLVLLSVKSHAGGGGGGCAPSCETEKFNPPTTAVAERPTVPVFTSTEYVSVVVPVPLAAPIVNQAGVPPMTDSVQAQPVCVVSTTDPDPAAEVNMSLAFAKLNVQAGGGAALQFVPPRNPQNAAYAALGASLVSRRPIPAVSCPLE